MEKELISRCFNDHIFGRRGIYNCNNMGENDIEKYEMLVIDI